MRRAVVLVLVLTLAGCDLPPPTHDALYPPHEDQLKQNFIITHDRYHPWEFQPIDNNL
jgi:hypothetical protein